MWLSVKDVGELVGEQESSSSFLLEFLGCFSVCNDSTFLDTCLFTACGTWEGCGQVLVSGILRMYVSGDSRWLLRSSYSNLMPGHGTIISG